MMYDENKAKQINPETLKLFQKYQIDMSIRDLSPTTVSSYNSDLMQWFIYMYDKQFNLSVVEATEEDTFEDLYMDSLDLVEIIIECEQEFGYPITDDKVQNLKTVGDLVNLIKDLDNKDYLESTQADLQIDE